MQYKLKYSGYCLYIDLVSLEVSSTFRNLIECDTFRVGQVRTFTQTTLKLQCSILFLQDLCIVQHWHYYAIHWLLYL